ncbi:hypothetical protein ES703_06715 [subsurface metagenome]
MGYATIHKYNEGKIIKVKDYEDLSKKMKKIAFDKFIANPDCREEIERGMEYFWFDKDGNAYRLEAKDTYVHKK